MEKKLKWADAVQRQSNDDYSRVGPGSSKVGVALCVVAVFGCRRSSRCRGAVSGKRVSDGLTPTNPFIKKWRSTGIVDLELIFQGNIPVKHSGRWVEVAGEAGGEEATRFAKFERQIAAGGNYRDLKRLQ
ncbi:hypothetical protein U1Q18_006874 [Sarracenia purpurea var. burkii]